MIRLLLFLILIGRVVLGAIISPPIVYEEFKNGVISKEIRIKNNSFDRVRYIVDIEGDKEYRKWSLEDDIKVFPRVISLGAKESKTVRLRVVKNDLKSGEYKCYIVFREREVKTDRNPIKNKEIVSNLRLLHNYWISIYGRYGEVDDSVEIDYQIDGRAVDTNIKSIGNAGRGIGLRIVNNKGKVVYKKPICRVMRGNDVSVETMLDSSIDEGVYIEYYDLKSEEAIKEVRINYEEDNRSNLSIN